VHCWKRKEKKKSRKPRRKKGVQRSGKVFRTSEQLFALSRPRRARLKAGSWRMARLVI